MLLSPNTINDGSSAAIKLPRGVVPLSPVRKPVLSQTSTTIATENNFDELRAQKHPEPARTSDSVFELQEINRMPVDDDLDEISTVTDGLLSDRPYSPLPQTHTDAAYSVPAHPSFPPLPSYGPPSAAQTLRCGIIRCSSFVLSLLFLGIIFLGSLIYGLATRLTRIWNHLNGKGIHEERKFLPEERARKLQRRDASRRWKRRQEKRDVDEEAPDECPPLEGGKDPVVSDVAYYARRVGLDVETFKVQTEDGFILTLWHIYNPQEYTSLPDSERQHRGPHVFTGRKDARRSPGSRRKYPVLMMHGLLQSSGAYCANDDDSLAFFLAKSGYDVWLGNNRCGIEPEHATLSASDPRMWSWTIQHMGVLDLAALISRILYETGFEKLGLVCHSQGTAQTFVALSKDQRPELGERISVFCALAPAVYAGPLVDRVYFRFMRNISPRTFELFFGIHAFIPIMITARRYLHPRLYGPMAYVVFSFLFNWSDSRWDHGLRDRMFQFAPVYVSTETIRWWLGADGFSTQKCILATPAEVGEDLRIGPSSPDAELSTSSHSWYGPQTPPFALWIGGRDLLVDGKQLLRRLNSGREPHVQIAHAKVIDDYEHLDVLWAMDMIEQVGREVRQVLWTTAPAGARARSIVPRGVE